MGIFNRHRHLSPEILSEYLDGRLDQHHQGLVARRLADCPACQEELNTLQATVAALRNLPDLPLPRSFTLPAAPSPDYSAELIRKPAPPAALVMKMPGWAYGGAASLAGLALALMLSAEAAGLAGPAPIPITGQATAAPVDDAVSEKAQFEADLLAPETADQAEAPARRAATAPRAARRAEPAPTSEAAAEVGDSALTAKSLAEPAGPAPQTAMAESQGAVESLFEVAGEEGAAVSGPEVAVEEAAAISGTPSEDGASLPEESIPSVLAEEVPPAPADPAQTLATEPEIPDENRSLPGEEYSATSTPTWWKALETTFAALTLAFLGGLFFRWRRNRSQSDA